MIGADIQAAPEILVDLRCLQDPNYAERGIGRHSLALLEGAGQCQAVARGARLTGLIDPDLPPLSDRARGAVGGLRSTAYPGALPGPLWFVEPSPMTHDPLFVARLLQHAGVLSGAAVYDFIPLDFAARYLRAPAARLDYHVALAWLARYDLFMPISAASAARLRQLVPADAADITVTGAPLDPGFERPRAPGEGTAAHVLVVGGDDPRKNVACAIKGHAGCASLQQARIPLVITGHYDTAQVRAMRGVASAAGGDPQLLRATGGVSDAELVSLYRNALCVVTPSLAEGFSLPVMEAMASGVPAVASDIAVHRELVARADLLFPADAPERLGMILAGLSGEADARQAIIRAQDAIWPRFRAAEVARRFWSAMDARAAEHAARREAVRAARVGQHRRPRVAMLSPLPPARSGVADYTAACCAELGRRVELHVFTDTAEPLRPQEVASLQPLSALPHLSGDFDRVISVMGNSDLHLRQFQLLRRHGGACIAHDSRMLGFYHQLFGPSRARAVAERELGCEVSTGDINAWLADESVLVPTLLGELAEVSEPLCVHSALTAAVAGRRFGIDPVHLPFAIYRPFAEAVLQPASRAAARARLGFQPGQVVIASFGFLHWSKAPYDCIWALDLLRGWGIPASLHFVGASFIDTGPLKALAASLGLAEHVVFAGGFVGESGYRDHLIGADLGLQLRNITGGAVSGALQDCIAAGLPSVANQGLAAAVEAPDYVGRVPDMLSPALIAEALATLLDDPARAHGWQEARRAYYARHNFAYYSDRLCAALGLDVAVAA